MTIAQGTVQATAWRRNRQPSTMGPSEVAGKIASLVAMTTAA